MYVDPWGVYPYELLVFNNFWTVGWLPKCTHSILFDFLPQFWVRCRHVSLLDTVEIAFGRHVSLLDTVEIAFGSIVWPCEALLSGTGSQSEKILCNYDIRICRTEMLRASNRLFLVYIFFSFFSPWTHIDQCLKEYRSFSD